MFGSMHTT